MARRCASCRTRTTSVQPATAASAPGIKPADATATAAQDVFDLDTHVNLTNSSGVREHDPDWAVDDSQIVYYRGETKPSGGLRRLGLYTLGIDPTAPPSELFSGAKDTPTLPAWRR